MAQKRMFSKAIINSDSFIEMPDSSQVLYFYLAMQEDDDGFVDNWKSIMRMTGKKEDDLKILITKKFIIPFESGIIVIKHWRIHNYIQNDRYTETKYKQEKALLSLDENKAYVLQQGQCIQDGYNVDTQNKNKNQILDINNIYGQIEGQKEEWEGQFEEFYKKYPKKVKKQEVKKWFKKNKPSSELFSSIMGRLEQFRGSMDWLKDNGRYIPYPSTWLNQKRWEDEIITKVPLKSTFNQRNYDDLSYLYSNNIKE